MSQPATNFIRPDGEVVSIVVNPSDTVYDVKSKLNDILGNWYNLATNGGILGSNPANGLYDLASSHLPGGENAVFIISTSGPGGAEPHRHIISEQYTFEDLFSQSSNNGNKLKNWHKKALTKTSRRLPEGWIKKTVRGHGRRWETIYVHSPSGFDTSTKPVTTTVANLMDAQLAILEDVAAVAESDAAEAKLQLSIHHRHKMSNIRKDKRQELAAKRQEDQGNIEIYNKLDATARAIAGAGGEWGPALLVPGTKLRPVEVISWAMPNERSEQNKRYSILKRLIPDVGAIEGDDNFSWRAHINRRRRALRGKEKHKHMSEST